MATDPEPEVIKQEIDETQESLKQKIGMLGDRLTDTVESTRQTVEETITSVKDAVGDTVDTVKETVSDTVEGVREAFDVRTQVQRRPWVMFGASVASGFVLARLLERRRRRYYGYRQSGFSAPLASAGTTATNAGGSSNHGAASHFTAGTSAGHSSGAAYSSGAASTSGGSSEPGVVGSMVKKAASGLNDLVDVEALKRAGYDMLKGFVQGLAAENLPPQVLQAMGLQPTPTNQFVTHQHGATSHATAGAGQHNQFSQPTTVRTSNGV